MNSREGGWTDETGGEKGMERGKEERERESDRERTVKFHRGPCSKRHSTSWGERDEIHSVCLKHLIMDVQKHKLSFRIINSL